MDLLSNINDDLLYFTMGNGLLQGRPNPPRHENCRKNVLGNLPDDMYNSLVTGYTKERAGLTAHLETVTEQIAEWTKETDSAAQFVELAEQYAGVKELDRDLLHRLAVTGVERTGQLLSGFLCCALRSCVERPCLYWAILSVFLDLYRPWFMTPQVSNVLHLELTLWPVFRAATLLDPSKLLTAKCRY